MINILVICDDVPPFFMTANEYVSEIVFSNSKGDFYKFPVHILFRSSGNGEPVALLIAGEKIISFSDAMKLWVNVSNKKPHRHYHVTSMRRRKK